jgi:hypothetical protein
LTGDWSKYISVATKIVNHIENVNGDMETNGSTVCPHCGKWKVAVKVGLHFAFNQTISRIPIALQNTMGTLMIEDTPTENNNINSNFTRSAGRPLYG